MMNIFHNFLNSVLPIAPWRKIRYIFLIEWRMQIYFATFFRGRMDSRVVDRSPPPAPKINRRSRSPHAYKGTKKSRVESHSTKPMAYSNSHYESPSPYSGSSKSLLGNYPQPVPSGVSGLYGSAPYRYSGSSSSYPGSYSMGAPAPLMSRPLGYPDLRSSGSSQRKY